MVTKQPKLLTSSRMRSAPTQWRRERESVFCTLASNKTEISARINEQDLETPFGETNIETILCFIGSTSVRKKVEACDARWTDE